MWGTLSFEWDSTIRIERGAIGHLFFFLHWDASIKQTNNIEETLVNWDTGYRNELSGISPVSYHESYPFVWISSLLDMEHNHSSKIPALQSCSFFSQEDKAHYITREEVAILKWRKRSVLIFCFCLVLQPIHVTVDSQLCHEADTDSLTTKNVARSRSTTDVYFTFY